MKHILAMCASLLLAACCPVSLRPEVTHVSHISQHFQRSYASDLGYNAVLLDLHVEPVPHLLVDIAEGMNIGREQHNIYGVPFIGGLMGPREVFSATVAWDIPLHR